LDFGAWRDEADGGAAEQIRGVRRNVGADFGEAEAEIGSGERKTRGRENARGRFS